MSENRDHLALLGQQLIDTVLARYTPDADGTHVLALHPGQALADDIVQGGATNELRLSQWIEDQYDYPLHLRKSGASSISLSSIGAITAKAAYLAMVPWAQPGVLANSPAYARISALIADARKSLGDNPAALPFSCEPTDFAESNSEAWHVFDATISQHRANTTTSAGHSIHPQFWNVRHRARETSLSPPAVASATKHHAAAEPARAAFAARAVPLASAVLGARMPGRVLEVAAADVRYVARQPVAPIAPTPSRTHMPVKLNVARARPSPLLADLEPAPAVTASTVSGSDLHVHFEYCMLTVTRRIGATRWWHSELLDEKCWFVPGMNRGDMIEPSSDGAYARYVPQALLLVRNVEIGGTWTTEAYETMKQGASFIGPFLMRSPVTTGTSSSVHQIKMLGVGIQVIGELCSLLPPLPPMNDPGGGG